MDAYFNYGYAAPMPNLVQANIHEPLMWEAQNEHLMPSNNYLTLYSENTPIPNLGDTFSAVGAAQEQLLEVYAHRPDASFLAPNTATLGATGPHDLSEAPTSLFPPKTPVARDL